MTTNAFVGRMYLERGDAGSPVAYTRVCQVFGISGLGQVNALVDATTFCSGGVREYIGGLADGTEVTIEANYEVGDAQLLGMINDVKAKASRDFRILVDDDADSVADATFYFRAACLGWTLSPSVDNKNTISFTVKISGDITIV